MKKQVLMHNVQHKADPNRKDIIYFCASHAIQKQDRV